MPYSSVSPVLARTRGGICPPGQSGAADAGDASSRAAPDAGSAVSATSRPRMRDRLIKSMYRFIELLLEHPRRAQVRDRRARAVVEVKHSEPSDERLVGAPRATCCQGADQTKMHVSAGSWTSRAACVMAS